MPTHKWAEVSFNYASWIECSCGYRPHSQQDMDAHASRIPDVGGEDRDAAYEAVYTSGLLTDDAFVNARIWRAVEAALNALE